MKLCIDEQTEGYVLERVRREGRSGSARRLLQNEYMCTIGLFECGEILTWVNIFTGRIISLECSNPEVTHRFYRDMKRMRGLYLGKEDDSGTIS